MKHVLSESHRLLLIIGSLRLHLTMRGGSILNLLKDIQRGTQAPYRIMKWLAMPHTVGNQMPRGCIIKMRGLLLPLIVLRRTMGAMEVLGYSLLLQTITKIIWVLEFNLHHPIMGAIQEHSHLTYPAACNMGALKGVLEGNCRRIRQFSSRKRGRSMFGT